MKIQALNCPNCGAGVPEDSIQCGHCTTRLKTKSCESCLGTIFDGSKFCPLCGKQAVRPNFSEKKTGDCPRCKTGLQLLEIGEICISECNRCEGVWVDIDTFEAICVSKENQSVVLKRLEEILRDADQVKIQYVPCPVCAELMNRNNFARVSGVIIDTCKSHGVWFDSNELPQIIDFIRKGGMDYSRQKEKAAIENERARLKAEQFKHSVDRFKHEGQSSFPRTKSSMAVREFIDFLLG